MVIIRISLLPLIQMRLADVINFCKIFSIIFFLTSCKKTYRYEVENANEKRNFRPYVGGMTSEYYTMHIVGELDGTAEVHLLSPEFNFLNGPFCSDYHEKLDSGKVDKFIHGDFYMTGIEPNLFYMPCTAKKGHLTIEIAFNKDLRNNK